MEKRFASDNINLSAYLAMLFNYKTIYSASAGKALFCFIDKPELRQAILDYESGVSAPAKNLLLTRTHLYHEASRVSGRRG